MRKTISLFVVLAAALVMAVPASALQFGTPDGDDHPQVGIAVFYTAEGRPLWRCSGALISPTRFLTAGHCTSGAAIAQVWFTSGRPAGYPFAGGVIGTPHAHPSYADFAAFPANFDVGMVVLHAAQPGPYASLAPAGYLDGVKGGSHTTFDLVGYGVQDALPPVLVAQVARYFGQAKLVNTKSAYNAGYNVQLTAAPGTGGALCFGDSGGPVFLAGTTTIVAVNSFVLNNQCMGSGFSYRTDTADSLAFINSFAP